jgi:4-hydroxy-4-methyl-2-oxoglutarate aldolase
LCLLLETVDMITDPPILKIRRSFPRPSPELIVAFAGTQTGFLVDCMDGRGAFDHGIKPLDGDNAEFVATAVTCHAGPNDNLAVFAALDVIAPGDAIVAAADGFTTTCIVGDLVLGMARNGGAVAFVTDGLVRDTDGIRDVGLPTFSRGVTPNSCVRNGPGTVGLPITLGNVPVAAGDILVGDRDGVVVVPLAKAEDVARRLVDVRAAEADMVAKVEGGMTAPDWLADLLASDRVETVN